LQALKAYRILQTGQVHNGFKSTFIQLGHGDIVRVDHKIPCSIMGGAEPVPECHQQHIIDSYELNPQGRNFFGSNFGADMVPM